MENTTISQGTSPLGIRIKGSGEYVKEQVAHLVDYFDMIIYDHEQEIRQDNEADRALVYGMQ